MDLLIFIIIIIIIIIIDKIIIIIWIVENLDNLVLKYIRQWLDLPISATFSGIVLSKNRFGLNLVLPSVKFI